jgi:proteasome lid subunit RPN8/RPN11
MITLSAKQKKFIADEVKQHYPHECCGILAGKIEGADKKVNQIYPVKNTNQERSVDRYNMDPKEFLEVSKKVEAAGDTIVSIYHSHPDHPDQPSEFDRAHAWEIYSYIIVGVQKGVDVSMRSFVLDAHTQFQEEEIRVQ